MTPKTKDPTPRAPKPETPIYESVKRDLGIDLGKLGPAASEADVITEVPIIPPDEVMTIDNPEDLEKAQENH